jgi:hypothetical protein
MPETDDWNEYKKLVLAELKRANNRLLVIESDLVDIKRELAVLKTKVYVGTATVAMIFSGVISLVIKMT